MQFNLEKQPKSVYLAKVSFDENEISEAKKAVLEYINEKNEFDGFRKGKAPLDIVEKNTHEHTIKDYIVNNLATVASMRAVKEHQLKPIMAPQAHVESFSWQELIMNITLIEEPEVKLGDYRGKIDKALEEKKAGKPIATAATLSEAEQKGQKEEEELETLDFNQIIDILKQTCQAEIPDQLTEKEMNSRLAQLVNRIEGVGMQINQYLESQSKTLEQLREEYKQQAEEALSIEFIVQAIAEKEQVVVNDKDIDEAVNAAPDEKTRQEFQNEEKREYIRTILRRSKTLISLSKGEFSN